MRHLASDHRLGLAMAAAGALVAGCGGEEPSKPGRPTTTARSAPPPRMVTVPSSFTLYTEPRVGVSLRHPRHFRREGRLPGAVLLRGGPQTVCVVALTDAPPLDTPAAQRRFAAQEAERLRRSSGGEVVIARSGRESGANLTGAGIVYRRPAAGESGHSVLLASAGGAVSLQCTAPHERFGRLERTVFQPLIASVTLRRDRRAEVLHRRLAGLSGVQSVSVRLERRAVVLNARLSTPRGRRVPLVRSLVVAAVRTFPGRDVSILASAADDPASPVIGRWEAPRRRGSVEEVGRPPRPIRLG